VTYPETKWWSHCDGWPTQKKWWSHYDGWPTQVEKERVVSFLWVTYPGGRMTSLLWVTYPSKKKMENGLILMGDLPRNKMMVSLWWVTYPEKMMVSLWWVTYPDVREKVFRKGSPCLETCPFWISKENILPRGNETVLVHNSYSFP